MANVSITDSDGTVRLHGNMSGGVMRWQAFKTITAAEWNTGVGAGHIDVFTLPTDAILYDAAVRASDDFNDTTGATGRFGWDYAGTPRQFGGILDLRGYADDWAGVSGNITPAVLSVLAASNSSVLAAYGPPAFVKDATTAGPLQFSPNANGDATLGTVTFWLYTDATP